MAIRRTIVVNINKSSYTKYIGRGSGFGNQYHIGWWYKPAGSLVQIMPTYFPDSKYITREISIELHRKDFYKNKKLQEKVWIELKGETLGCHCKPLACHGDTYVEYIKNRMRQN